MKRWMLACVLAVAPMGSAVTAQETSDRNQILIAVQDICPVSGKKLGEQGTPIKVKIGDEAVFLASKECLQGKVNPQHWATIHANFAKAQKICPIMKHELPENPKWTIVEGRIFYVCCPPCIEKITANAKTSLEQLDDLYRTSLKVRTNVANSGGGKTTVQR